VLTLESWLAFVAASLVLLILPGPTILTVIGYSLAHGKRANIPLVAGVALGDCTALLLSIVGLGALLKTSALWFTLLKLVGGCYLIYLGVKMLRAGAGEMAVTTTAPALTPWRLFSNTYLVTALNPKGIVFFVAFLPQFLNHNGQESLQLMLLATTFVILATINATLYATFAATARRFLQTPKLRRRFHLLGGSLLTGAGLWALYARRMV
jgi:threonine/homoserine/homoserine lactone efflux protein